MLLHISCVLNKFVLLLLLLCCCSNDLASSHFQSPFSRVIWLWLTHFSTQRLFFRLLLLLRFSLQLRCAWRVRESVCAHARAQFLVLRSSSYCTGTDTNTPYHWTPRKNISMLWCKRVSISLYAVASECISSSWLFRLLIFSYRGWMHSMRKSV